MKSLILLAAILLCFQTPARAEETLSRNAAFAQIQASTAQLTTGLYANELSITEFEEILKTLSEDLYSNGYISLSQLNGKLSQVAACVTAHKAIGGIDEILNRNAKCGVAVDFNGLKASKPACVAANGLLAGAECCNNLVPGVSPTLEKTAVGKKTNEACNAHAECASKHCDSDTGGAGICAPVQTCFPLIPVGGECSPENPNCQSGVCRPQDVGLGGVTCKPDTSACTSGTECCSTKCSANKCVEKYLCEKCITEGQKPTGQDQCCRGLIKDIDGFCILEMPPFILPGSSSVIRDFWKQFVSNILPVSSAHAQAIPTTTTEVPGTSGEGEGESSNSSGGNGTFGSDDALTLAQLDMIEGEITKILAIKDKNVRKQKLLAIYAQRKNMSAANAAAAAGGKPVGKTFTQEEYVKRYNIPSITPKERSVVERCEFNTAKDNWIDSSNMMRNAELFMRSFEVSYSGKGTQDTWHLLNSGYQPNQKNLYTRTKEMMTEIRDNRNYQRDQLKYLDLLMSCQCIYTFGPEKFDQEKQTFFFSMCTGKPENKICRDGEMRDNLKLPESTEQPYKEGVEFPNYVEMYLAKLEKMAGQNTGAEGDVDNIDSGAAGINHEEVLVRWLRLRSCNQVDVFMDVEKVEAEAQSIVEDLNRAKKVNPTLKSYWDARLTQMQNGGVDKGIVDIFRKDTKKDTWYRGYVHTESKVHSWTKKTLKFLLFLILAILAVVTMGLAAVAIGIIAVTATVILAVGAIVSSSNNATGSFDVLENFSKDFPNVIIEDRLVEKKSCGFLKLFYCKTFYRILHWPAFSNRPGIQQAFPWNKREERTCDQTYSTAVSYPGVDPNPCKGPFKGTMCARSFFRPIPDSKIASQTDFAPWKAMMSDKMLMDPVFPEFFNEELNLNNGWIGSMQQGFQKGCAWVKTIGKAKAKPEDKAKFFPDFKQYIDGSGNFLPKYQFTQARIDDYKKAVEKYALCKDLYECGAKNYDGKHPSPWGFGDIVETKENAELLANYTYQIHFNWRHMSGEAGIGYPLAYLENYYMSLLHNLRLLTTLSIRRGIELDDAYNKYAEDLAIRRSRYQITGKKYGLEMGKEGTVRVVPSAIYGSLRALGFPLSSDFKGLPTGGGIGSSSSANQGSASGQTLSTFELNALNAAKRHANGVATDNKKWQNFKDQTKGNADANRRLAGARKFFGGVNNPLAAVPGMRKAGDNSSYSGIGGQLSGSSNSTADKGEGEDLEQKYGAVGDGKSGGASGGASSGSGLGANGSGGNSSGANGAGADGDYMNGLLGDGNGANGAGGDNSGANGAGADGQNGLADAARVTGMKEGDLANMLESADKNRKNLEGGEEDSLFQKVSKAYLRNLDRVLVRKKSAEKPKKKDEADPEKEEIKKIFEQ